MPSRPPVTLRPVTRVNVRAVCDLRLADHQQRLVAPAAFTVAEGHYEPGALLRAIYAGEQPVGVLLVEVETGTPYLVRFMIDAAHQGGGNGRQAVALLEDELRAAGWDALETSFVPVDGGAEGFWRRCGFVDTGRRLHGEPVFRRELREAEPVAGEAAS
jgi:diamine N-acetyltransferase